MIHYILAIAALNGLDMERIILEKDKKASVKYHHDINLEQFLTEAAFREAFASGFTELWQLAEYFDLPESDIRSALDYWTVNRGIDFSKQEAGKCTSP